MRWPEIPFRNQKLGHSTLSRGAHTGREKFATGPLRGRREAAGGANPFQIALHGHVWTTAPVQGKNGRSATWSGAVMCSASKDAVRMTAGHDEFRGSGPNHFAAQCVPWPFRVFPIPA